MNILTKIFLGVLLSFYFFPIGFSFLPESVNTKMILAVLGVLFVVWDNYEFTKISVNWNLVTSTVIAFLFSIICLYSADYNGTDDFSYASYFVSFFVWLFGAYAIRWFFKYYYGSFTFRNFVYYVAVVCVIQCILALLIDNFPGFKLVVNSVVLQGQEFLEEVQRLYGIGAALDTGGIRFSIALVLISSLLGNDEHVRNNTKIYLLLLFSFFVIGIIGAMISRTTIVGFGLGFFYMLFSLDIFRRMVKYRSLVTSLIFILVLGVIIFSAVYIYINSVEYRENLRFAFEGFFNWFETGEWRTSSTDKLNKEMWIWPKDMKTWIIGSGIFGHFVYSTDIGYCRFILYCGLVGFSVFSLLFVYNSFVFMIKVPQYRLMFLAFGILPFIIWLKVATDIFFIFALFYCIESFSVADENLALEGDENSI